MFDMLEKVTVCVIAKYFFSESLNFFFGRLLDWSFFLFLPGFGPYTAVFPEEFLAVPNHLFDPLVDPSVRCLVVLREKNSSMAL